MHFTALHNTNPPTAESVLWDGDWPCRQLQEEDHCFHMLHTLFYEVVKQNDPHHTHKKQEHAANIPAATFGSLLATIKLSNSHYKFKLLHAWTTFRASCLTGR